jgi:hypothetical protein
MKAFDLNFESSQVARFDDSDGQEGRAGDFGMRPPDPAFGSARTLAEAK